MAGMYPPSGWWKLDDGHEAHIKGSVERAGRLKGQWQYEAVRYATGERKKFDRMKKAKKWVLDEQA
jgi:hypothetical protein